MYHCWVSAQDSQGMIMVAKKTNYNLKSPGPLAVRGESFIDLRSVKFILLLANLGVGVCLTKCCGTPKIQCYDDG